MLSSLKEHNSIIKKARARERDPVKLKALQALVFGNYHHIIPRSCEKYYEVLRFLGGKVGELVWLTYREHERIHVLLIDIAPNEEIRVKMQWALQWFYDKNGTVFSDKEKKKHREAASEALIYYNKLKYGGHNRGKKYPKISENLKGDKHPSHKPEWKGPTQMGMLFDIKNNNLLNIASVDVERRINGKETGWSVNRKPGDGHQHACVKCLSWYKEIDHSKTIIKQFKTRKEANAAKRLADKVLKPKYKGKFNLPHIVAEREQRKSTRENGHGKEMDYKRSKKSLSERFSSRVAL